ncbi:MAG TPA: ATP synthase F0 subunit B, partial [Candidatus Acidoferrum sp.]|nr:ATP synthase F0 subunit B [Candidatus Acidoferrum sp.]
LAAEEAARHEEPGIINLNITLLIQVVNFLILIALLSKFLFKPLTRFLAERAEGIDPDQIIEDLLTRVPTSPAKVALLPDDL